MSEGAAGEDLVARAARLWCTEEDLGHTDEREAVREYRTSVLKKMTFTIVCVVAAVITGGLSLGYGSVDIPFTKCYEILWNHITGNIGDKLNDYIVTQERLPRILTALVTGAALAVAGCVMQSVLKNPLADPYTTGISSGAGFGATIAIVAGITLMSGEYSTVINAFIFSLVPMGIIVGVSRMKGSNPTTMIMAGMAVMFIFNAVTTVFKLMADPDKLAELYAWTVGTVADTDWDSVPLMIFVTVACTIVVQMMSTKLNVLATGDDNAKAMGLDVENLRMVLLVLVSLMVASVVSFTGLIGFVGLVAPHVCRMFVGADNRYLVISSAMFGAVLLEVADLAGRTVIAPAELQVGVVTAFIGGPMFLYLILRQRKSAW